MRKTIFIVVPMLAAMGCASQRMALRPQEPADRWTLSVSPKIEAPLEQPMTELPPMTLSIWALSSTPVVFISSIAPTDRGPWFMLAETLDARLVSSGPLDLIYPPPSTIILAEDNAETKNMTRLMTAEARIFSAQ